jgi:hypothetical protein
VIRAALVGAFFCIGVILSLSDPAAWLDEKASQILLRHMPGPDEIKVCRVKLTRTSSAQDLGDQIMELKSQGVQGVLLLCAPRDWSLAFNSAVAQEGVVVVADPEMNELTSRQAAKCRPLLICQAVGFAVIRKEGMGQFESATALALSCAQDSKTFNRVGVKPFRLLFHSKPYGGLEAITNAVIACVTKDGYSEDVRYATPAGQRDIADYALDVCQASAGSEVLGKHQRNRPMRHLRYAIAPACNGWSPMARRAFLHRTDVSQRWQFAWKD